jgi:hypothetical protein
MFRVYVQHHDHRLELTIDEHIDRSCFYLAATYRQLVIASQCLLTVYNLAPLLVDKTFSNVYERIVSCHPILALTSTIDRIIYIHRSSESDKQLKVCSLPALPRGEQDLIIDSLNINEPIHLCSLDDGTIYIAQHCHIYSLDNRHWSFESKIVKLTSGKEHVLVLLADGRLLTWGNGLHGALGLGDLEPCLTPTHIDCLSNQVKDIAAGGWHSLGRDKTCRLIFRRRI